MYKRILRPLLYKMQPESAHYFATSWLERFYKSGLLDSPIAPWFKLDHPSLEREVFGVKFPNPVGLAAGFDKDAKWIDALSALGFGFIEIGTVTPKPQPGNPKPRMFRLQKDEALINRMGFNNDGVEAAVDRIKNARHNVPVGGNIGKNKATHNEDAVSDYRLAFEKLYNHVDYFAVNVSSPNTPGLRELQGKDALKRIFESLFEYRSMQTLKKPVLLKIAPDLNEEQLLDIISLVKEIEIDGLIATNTTLSRDGLKSHSNLVQQIGGLSGVPLRERSTEVIRFIHRESGGNIPMIGVGGIHSASDALDKIEAGASLVQLYTGFIYEGPGLIKSINEKLIK
ncbi:MAG: quinone-dependent dihydroorotate dehydrogenase [Salibacteraceae bacterium]